MKDNQLGCYAVPSIVNQQSPKCNKCEAIHSCAGESIKKLKSTAPNAHTVAKLNSLAKFVVASDVGFQEQINLDGLNSNVRSIAGQIIKHGMVRDNIGDKINPFITRNSNQKILCDLLIEAGEFTMHELKKAILKNKDISTRSLDTTCSALIKAFEVTGVIRKSNRGWGLCL